MSYLTDLHFYIQLPWQRTALTMQFLLAQQQKNFLVTALSNYSSAVNNMEQTVMLPSLLQDIPVNDYDESKDAADTSHNMYECYLLLKSIKNTVESSMLPSEDLKQNINSAYDLESDEEANLEKLLYVHVKGLCTVLNTLTNKANTLTSKYKDRIGLFS
ncbi:mid1-interacting protein 1-B-like [Hypanus sabinus]|uniref:mid1-interacting protein 1-B-like n=1 Tax=Hypanus sabinus TaxID=79690 RepID=UPI0028C42940|nr:mid1-interacting protein 1-B-like [Hypanus sabinus]